MSSPPGTKTTASPLLLGATAFFAVHFVLTVFYSLLFRGGSAGTGISWVFLLKPGVVLAASILLTWLNYRARVTGPTWLRFVTIALMGATVFLFANTAWGWSVPRAKVLVLFVIVCWIIALVSRLAFRQRQLRAATLLCLTIVVTLGLLVIVPKKVSNRLGLISNDPGSTVVRDYSGNTNKDNYPICTFEYNSLGYRDLEPPEETVGRQRVLLVGDSFVWGDGIPTNEETLPYRLRDALALRAPGTFDVMAGAFPGLDLYGYVRFAEVLQPHLSADIVVISYQEDCRLSDSQYLLDQATENALLQGLFVRFSVLQYAHEFVGTIEHESGESADRADFCQSRLDELGRHATEGEYKLLFLSWSEERPQELNWFNVVGLPEELRYQGESSDLWYAKDNHPKPPLLRLVADIVADALIQLQDGELDETLAMPGQDGRRRVSQVGPFSTGLDTGNGWTLTELATVGQAFRVGLDSVLGQLTFEIGCTESEHPSPFEWGEVQIFYDTTDLEFHVVEPIGSWLRDTAAHAAGSSPPCAAISQWISESTATVRQ